MVQFTCDPGHSLEQGPPVIECISARDPYWNDTEPLCKGNTEGTTLRVFHVPVRKTRREMACFEQKASPVVICDDQFRRKETD